MAVGGDANRTMAVDRIRAVVWHAGERAGAAMQSRVVRVGSDRPPAPFADFVRPNPGAPCLAAVPETVDGERASRRGGQFDRQIDVRKWIVPPPLAFEG